MTRAFLLLLTIALGCRTPPNTIAAASDLAVAADLTSSAGGSVNCGAAGTCSIADGEHCCDGSPLDCQTAACPDSNQFDCDGPEDCGGSPCCFQPGSAFWRASCAATCDNGIVLCQALADCPARTVCCTNFVLGSGNGLCLAACD